VIFPDSKCKKATSSPLVHFIPSFAFAKNRVLPSLPCCFQTPQTIISSSSLQSVVFFSLLLSFFFVGACPKVRLRRGFAVIIDPGSHQNPLFFYVVVPFRPIRRSYFDPHLWIFVPVKNSLQFIYLLSFRFPFSLFA